MIRNRGGWGVFGVAISILLLVGGLVRIAQNASSPQTVEDAANVLVDLGRALVGLLLSTGPGVDVLVGRLLGG